MSRWTKLTACAAASAAAITLAACGSDSGSGSDSGVVTIGASLSQSGPLGQFGPLIDAGYKQAVAQVNAQGGLQVGDERRQVKLVTLDNRSDPKLAAQQARTLVTDKGAVALLGAASPPINLPMASTAEALRIPFVTSFTPVTPWLAASKSGFRYSWDFFLDPPAAITAELKTASSVDTNKKIALFTDNEADGQAWGQIVNAIAPKMGFEVVSHATFPAGTTNFRSFVQKADASGAQIVIATMVPPDGIALWKQMKALGFRPKVAFCEKCGNAGAFQKALGPISDGTNAVGLWTTAEDLPGTAAAKATLGKQLDNDHDLAVAVAAETGMQIVLDAIARAGTTDPNRVNAAIAKTDKTYTFAHIKFGEGNAAQTPALMVQWQRADAVQVFPQVPGASVQFPAQGLR